MAYLADFGGGFGHPDRAAVQQGCLPLLDRRGVSDPPCIFIKPWMALFSLHALQWRLLEPSSYEYPHFWTVPHSWAASLALGMLTPHAGRTARAAGTAAGQRQVPHPSGPPPGTRPGARPQAADRHQGDRRVRGLPAAEGTGVPCHPALRRGAGAGPRPGRSGVFRGVWRAGCLPCNPATASRVLF